MPENLEPDDFYIERAGIMTEFGKIICISATFFYPQNGEEYAFKVKTVTGDSEKQVLLDFFELAGKFYEKKHISLSPGMISVNLISLLFVGGAWSMD